MSSQRVRYRAAPTAIFELNKKRKHYKTWNLTNLNHAFYSSHLKGGYLNNVRSLMFENRNWFAPFH